MAVIHYKCVMFSQTMQSIPMMDYSGIKYRAGRKTEVIQVNFNPNETTPQIVPKTQPSWWHPQAPNSAKTTGPVWTQPPPPPPPLPPPPPPGYQAEKSYPGYLGLRMGQAQDREGAYTWPGALSGAQLRLTIHLAYNSRYENFIRFSALLLWNIKH